MCHPGRANLYGEARDPKNSQDPLISLDMYINAFAYVYILASCRNGTLYVGITSNLHRRVWDHKQGIASKFTQRYGVDKLMYFEPHDDINVAIRREKSLKRWRRLWKMRLIEKSNPDRHDLWLDISS